MFSGISIALIEIFLYILVSFLMRKYLFKNLQKIDLLSYYWFNMTVLTFIWELSFIYYYFDVNKLSSKFIEKKEHVWTNEYPLNYINPINLSKIFYAEYGAYADREYMDPFNYWSRVIEGTHAFMCGTGSLLAIISKVKDKNNHFLIYSSISMGSQLMNSILYMNNYFIQIKTPDNINYNTSTFPTGHLLLKRPFMYVNIFWTLMPLYVIIKSIYIHKKQKYNIIYPSDKYNFLHNYNE